MIIPRASSDATRGFVQTRAGQFAVLVAGAMTASASATEVLPPHSIVPPTAEGRSIGEWTADWWQWALPPAVPDSPLVDKTGENANNGQPLDGPVFFVAGSVGGDFERTFNVPAGKYLLVPMVNFVLWQNPEFYNLNEEELRAFTQDVIDSEVTFLVFFLDGLPINHFLHRESTPAAFSFDFLEGSPTGAPTANSGMAVAEGYWVMLTPLTEGEQITITFGGGGPAFSTQGIVHITAVPVDCNANGIMDTCDIDCGAMGGVCNVPGCGGSEDCDGNGIPDECDPDCFPLNAPNGVPDPCDIVNCPPDMPECADCNTNNVPDACDTAFGFSEDCQNDTIPDECQTTGAVFASWAADAGNWNDGSLWCPDLTPNFPDNQLGTSYHVTIEGQQSLVTLNTSPTIESLSLVDGATVVVNDASGANVRTIAVDGPIVSSGVLRATDRERLVLDAPIIDQGGICEPCDTPCPNVGILEAVDGAEGPGETVDKSILEINGATVVGGIARTIGASSEIQLIGGAELVDVCVQGVVVPDGQTGGFAGTITNNGVLAVAPNGQGTTLLAPALDGTGVLEGNGGGDDCVRLGGQTAAQLGNFKSTFTNASNHAVDGAGIIFGGMTNEGLLHANMPGQDLILFPPGVKTNNGEARASGGGTLRISTNVVGAGTYNADGGTIRLAPNGGSASISGSAMNVTSGGVVQTEEGADITLTAAVTIDSGGTYQGAAGPSGTLSAASASVFGDGDGGQMLLTDAMSADISGLTLIDGTAGPCLGFARGCTPPILRAAGSATVSAASLTVLAGETMLAGGATMGVGGAMTINQGGIVTNDGTTTAMVTAGSVAIMSDGGGMPNGSTLQVGSAMILVVSGNVVVGGCGAGGFAPGGKTAMPPDDVPPAGDATPSGAKKAMTPGNAPPPGGKRAPKADGVAAPPGGSREPRSAAIPRGCTPPILRVVDTGSLNVAGNLVLSGWSTVEVQSGTTVNLAGDFDNQSTNPVEAEGFNWSSGLLTMNAGAAGPVQQFELAGEDRGVSASGFIDNYAMDTLNVSGGTAIEFVDNFDNVPGGGCEVLYVHTLKLRAGSTITLHCNVYYDTLIDEGATVNEAGGALVCLVVGDLDCNGALDMDDMAIFIAVLLGADTDPAHVAAADLNYDGSLDGGDIQAFVDAVLPPS